MKSKASIIKKKQKDIQKNDVNPENKESSWNATLDYKVNLSKVINYSSTKGTTH